MPALKNAKHEAVAQAYIADAERSGPRAYRGVYPKSSQHAAETAYGRLLKKAEFRERIAELEGKSAELAVAAGVMSRLEVLQELSSIGRGNMQDYVVRGDDVGEVVAALRDLPRGHAAAIQELTIDTYMDGAGDDAREVKRVRLKLHDKRGALRDLGQHYKLFTEKIEHAGAGGGPIKTEGMSELELARRIAFALEQGARSAATAQPAVKRSAE